VPAKTNPEAKISSCMSQSATLYQEQEY